MDVRPLFVFLQRLFDFAAERNLTDVVEQDWYDVTHQVHEPGDADEITELDKQHWIDTDGLVLFTHKI